MYVHIRIGIKVRPAPSSSPPSTSSSITLNLNKPNSNLIFGIYPNKYIRRRRQKHPEYPWTRTRWFKKKRVASAEGLSDLEGPVSPMRNSKLMTVEAEKEKKKSLAAAAAQPREILNTPPRIPSCSSSYPNPGSTTGRVVSSTHTTPMVAAGVMLGPTHEQNNGKKSQDFQVIVNDELQKVNSIKESQAKERPLATSINFKSESDDNLGSSSLPGLVADSPHLLSPVIARLGLRVTSLDITCQATTSNDNKQAKQSPGFFTRFIFRKRTYTNQHLVLTALIFFLLGSILRYLLIPSNYLIIPPSPPPSSMCCISHPPPLPAATLSTATTLKNEDIKNVQDHDGHHHHHPVIDYCAQPNDPNQDRAQGATDCLAASKLAGNPLPKRISNSAEHVGQAERDEHLFLAGSVERT
ncbi:uncharacterized protein PGTG_05193 [Puccinia graminis f. sp. tritici CRL 75-36-700-3]|uniref:Uncharacterized protein n=1 Tax=Puccinia graminis f. sp. tritici (strain CRL 75-36-700-3 / race SCCL) TaxID=418459 RepID=E3K709_PUCGT|nr:uncharacterized protein PGTG_05193 [Puccinia graminis f. sp. tritici CRL 75-36-700-3]EFP79968.2 hypothetical protein PGTG_05193 [Puccinia graminis f. sp. tritici CRL 75-36-700-3]